MVFIFPVRVPRMCTVFVFRVDNGSRVCVLHECVLHERWQVKSGIKCMSEFGIMTDIFFAV